jgi:hypothetical protein
MSFLLFRWVEKMKKNIFYLDVICFMIMITNGSATATSIFGPTQYIRTTGPKNVYTATYAATPGPGIITIVNLHPHSGWHQEAPLEGISANLITGCNEKFIIQIFAL